jgi:hypothetical protein
MCEENRGQCEGCLGYFDECELEQPVICKECLDKAAGYDSKDNSLRKARSAMENAKKELDKLQGMPVQVALYVSRAKGMLTVGLEVTK